MLCERCVVDIMLSGIRLRGGLDAKIPNKD